MLKVKSLVISNGLPIDLYREYCKTKLVRAFFFNNLI